jgi:hypothetical protein
VLPTGAVLVLLAGLLAGCRTDSQGAGGAPASSATGSLPGATAARSSGSAGRCGGASDPRLRSVTLAVASSGLTVTWTSTGTDKAAGAIWVVTVSGGQRNDYQLTVKATNGVAGSYVFNVGTSTQTDVHQPGSITVTPTGARESFPWADLTGIGSEFTWNAVLNIDGSDVAYCPADMTFLAFQR